MDYLETWSQGPGRADSWLQVSVNVQPLSSKTKTNQPTTITTTKMFLKFMVEILGAIAGVRLYMQ